MAYLKEREVAVIASVAPLAAKTFMITITVYAVLVLLGVVQMDPFWQQVFSR